ncbi:hypothetical protein [Nocardioides convexus]|uniref:hypothetical protein n=1 Tax=Nocardioides convexus TaxID=2712224 RepID=UPI0024189E81|nr:hypothetical protein [Nocardioides convexus]
MRLRIDLAYDGGDFRGWAAQPSLRTVQGEPDDRADDGPPAARGGAGDLRRAHRRRRARARPGGPPRPRPGGLEDRRAAGDPSSTCWRGGSTASCPVTCGYDA